MPRKSGTSNQQLPILPVRRQTSTFGVYVLNFCVRHGYRWFHTAIATGSFSYALPAHSKLYRRNSDPWFAFSKLSLRQISSSQLHALQHFYPYPIYLVFFKVS